MPKITVSDRSGDFPPDKRLVLAIEALGVNIGHRCGGKAACTTCRVVFAAGEPETMTRAEFLKLGLDKPGAAAPPYRLSCQILCTHDMDVEPIMTLENQPWKDTGPTPTETVQPEAQWYPRDEIARELSGSQQ